MSEDTTVLNVNTDYVDANGNKLVWSDEVFSVYHYDATTSGTQESWTKRWSTTNPFVNHDFSITITGSEGGWSIDSDVGHPLTCEYTQHAGWGSIDLLEGSTVTSSGYSSYAHTNLINFESNYGWQTSSAAGNGAFAVTFDMESEKDISHFWFIPCFGTVVGRAIKGYRVGVSNTGGENDYTIVASGITEYGKYTPVIDTFWGVSARYIKLYIDSNWGDVSNTRVWKASAFYNPNWSLFSYNNIDFTTGTDAFVHQTVDLGPYSDLYVDMRARPTNSTQVGRMSVSLSGVGGSSVETPVDYIWSNTGTSWLDVLDGDYWTRLEELIDVSSYAGLTNIRFRGYAKQFGLLGFKGFFDNVYTSPLWSREGLSQYRGHTNHFPNELYIVSDREGVSLIDKRDMSLWMRFDVGMGHMLGSPARQIYAKEGYIYLATALGLIIIDFRNNRAWKLNSAGLYYRMSIGNRNEYSQWFLQTAAVSLPSDDTYSVDGGVHDSTYFVIVGHGRGLSYVSNIDISTRVVNSSSFTYPVPKVLVSANSAKEAEKVFYVGGWGKEAKVGVLESMSVIKSGSIIEDKSLYSSSFLYPDTFTSGISEQWEVLHGNIPVGSYPGYITVSGIKSDIGGSLILQKEKSPVRPFKASMDVKIEGWPDRCSGGIHFGVTSGWPLDNFLYGSSSHALSLSAVNGISLPQAENETFSKYPSFNRWVCINPAGGASRPNMEIGIREGSLYISGDIFYGTGYASSGALVGSKTLITGVDFFTVKIKVKSIDIGLVTADRRTYILFGITDGEYLGEGTGTSGLAMALYGRTGDVDPPVYAMASKTSNLQWVDDTTTTLPLFSNDLTSDAEWHTWEFSYVFSTKTMSSSVDGIYLGSKQNLSLGASVGIVFGIVGGDVATARFKDFEIDFGDLPPHSKREYVLQRYDEGVVTRPLASGIHLEGIPFYGLDGSAGAAWRTWEIEWDGYSFYGRVDGVDTGTSYSLDLSPSSSVFIYYDVPATASGVPISTDIKIKDFNIQYTGEDTLLSGVPNDLWKTFGSSSLINYNTLYVATSSGVNQLNYEEGTSISGVPAYSKSIGNVYSSMEIDSIFGNISNCGSVESEEGAVNDNGLLYIGTTSYNDLGWSRLQPRPYSSSVDRFRMTAAADGEYVYLSYRKDGNRPIEVYRKRVDTLTTDWEVIAQREQTLRLRNVTSHAVFPIGMYDGFVYVLADLYVGIYNNEGSFWVDPDVNTRNINGWEEGTLLSWSISPILTRNIIVKIGREEGSLYFCSLQMQTPIRSMFRELHGLGSETACAYADVDDSIYVLKQTSLGDSNNFYKFSYKTNTQSDFLSGCPLYLTTDHGVSCFYRPYDESVYVVTHSVYPVHNRRIARYDIKQNEWFFVDTSLPDTTYTYMSVSYSPVSDSMFFSTGWGNDRIYKYKFPSSVIPRYKSWESSEGVLPEDSLNCRFIKVSPDSNGFCLSDDFTRIGFDASWFRFVLGVDSSVSLTGENINFICTHYNQRGAGVVVPIPRPVCSFRATAKVKIKDMVSSDGFGSNDDNSFLIGITDFRGVPSYKAAGDNTAIGMSYVGENGLFMAAMNRPSDVSNKYTVYSAENGQDTYYNATQYVNFSDGDGTPSADYKEWGIEYDHPNKKLDAYVNSVFVGSVSLTGRGFEHGASLWLGTIKHGTSVSGIMDVDVKDLDISIGGSSSLVSNYLRIDDNDEYGYQYYEKWDSLIRSSAGYAYEIDFRVETYAVTDNVYVTSVGCMEDGDRKFLVAALYDTNKYIGVYKGGDPRQIASYEKVLYDWSIRSTYTLINNIGGYEVRVEGTSVIEVLSEELPKTEDRKVCFGSANPDVIKYGNAASNNSSLTTVSGSWTKEGTTWRYNSFYGIDLSHTSSSVDDKVIIKFKDSGDGYLYMFYVSHSSFSIVTPITVYHSGVIEVPIPDLYASNPLNTVSPDVDEYGNSFSGATTITVNQTRQCSGGVDRSILSNGNPSGWVYLGRYTDIDRVVVTCNGTGSGRVDVDSFMIKHTDEQPRSRSVSRVYSVAYSTEDTIIRKNSDFVGGLSVINLEDGSLVDYFGESSSPNILNDNISDITVVK